MTSQPGFFDLQSRYEKLSELGDPLEALSAAVDFEQFRRLLNQVRQNKARKSAAGRKPFDVVLMFKVLVLQGLYNLSDDQTEFQIRDRFSFLRFLGLTPESRIPDAKTIWLFRERLKELALVDKLFERFDRSLLEHGYRAEQGQIVDARIVAAPRQRNSRDQNETIKAGLRPSEWEDQPHKKAQKDIDARWTRKNGQNHYGYKNHINIDRRYKLIRRQQTTSAAVHDSQCFKPLLDKANRAKSVWADGAYRSAEHDKLLKRKRLCNRIHHRPWRGQCLTEAQRQINRRRSTARARVEHVFGHQVNSMNMRVIRTIGLARARVKVGMANLVYNMQRFTFLQAATG